MKLNVFISVTGVFSFSGDARLLGRKELFFNPEVPYKGPKVPCFNPEVTYKCPEVPCFNPEVLYKSPEVPCFNPEVPYKGPKVPCFNPEVPYKCPKVPCFNPEVLYKSPEVPFFNFGALFPETEAASAGINELLRSVKRIFISGVELFRRKPAQGSCRLVRLYFVARFKVNANYYRTSRLSVATNGTPFQCIYCNCYRKIKSDNNHLQLQKRAFVQIPFYRAESCK